MAMPSRADLMNLDVAARLELIEALWESIVGDDDTGAKVPLTEAQRALLDERLREHRAGHSAARAWQDIRADILNKAR